MEPSVKLGRSIGTAARPARQFVVFSQNHDQVGNRPAGDRLSATQPLDRLKLAVDPRRAGITGVRVTLQYLLHLQSESVHPTTHVRNTVRQPHLGVRCDRDHDCSACNTRCNATTVTS